MFLAMGPFIALAWTLIIVGDAAFLDFSNELWPGAKAVLDGVSPYPPLDEVATGARFVFPAPAALLVAPLAPLPLPAAEVVFAIVLVGAGLLTLRILGITDWRVYGAMFLWAPVLSAVQTGNLTLLLVLSAALAWRYRGRPWIAGTVLGLAVAVKLIIWPLAIWFLATRRFKGAAVALGVAASTLMVSGRGRLPLLPERRPHSRRRLRAGELHAVRILPSARARSARGTLPLCAPHDTTPQ